MKLIHSPYSQRIPNTRITRVGSLMLNQSQNLNADTSDAEPEQKNTATHTAVRFGCASVFVALGAAAFVGVGFLVAKLFVVIW